MEARKFQENTLLLLKRKINWQGFFKQIVWVYLLIIIVKMD